MRLKIAALAFPALLAMPLLTASPPPMQLTPDPNPPRLPAGLPLRADETLPNHENWMLIDNTVPMISNATAPTLAPVWPASWLPWNASWARLWPASR